MSLYTKKHLLMIIISSMVLAVICTGVIVLAIKLNQGNIKDFSFEDLLINFILFTVINLIFVVIAIHFIDIREENQVNDERRIAIVPTKTLIPLLPISLSSNKFPEIQMGE